MMGNFGVGVVAIIVVIIFVIVQLWYIILPLTALGIGIYSGLFKRIGNSIIDNESLNFLILKQNDACKDCFIVRH